MRSIKEAFVLSACLLPCLLMAQSSSLVVKLHGKSVLKHRGRDLVVQSAEVIQEGDDLTLFDNAKVRILFYRHRERVQLSGSGKLRCRNGKLVRVSGKLAATALVNSESRDVLQLTNGGIGGIVLKGGSSDVFIKTPLETRRDIPSEIAWGISPTSKALTGPPLKAAQVFVTSAKSAVVFSQTVFNGITRAEVPSGTLQPGIDYFVTVRVYGEGTEYMVERPLRVLSAEQVKAIEAMDRAAQVAQKPEDILESASVFRIMKMYGDCDRLFRLAESRFGGDSDVKAVVQEWRSTPEFKQLAKEVGH